MNGTNESKVIDLAVKGCPFAAGVAVSPQGRGAVIAPPCAKEKCAVWDTTDGMCSVLSFACNVDDIRTVLNTIRIELSDLRMVLTPPKDSPSPLMRMADAMEAMHKRQETKKG